VNLIARIEIARTVKSMELNKVNKTIYKSPALAPLIRSLTAKPRDVHREEIVRFIAITAESVGVDND
jgi:hypothetical protein